MNDTDKSPQGAPSDEGAGREPRPDPSVVPPPLDYISKGYDPAKPNPLPRVRETKEAARKGKK